MRRFLILLQFIILAAANQAIAQTVETEYAMLLTSTDPSQLSDDEQAAYDWFQANYTTQRASTGKPKGTFLAPGDLSRLSAGYTKVLWVHIDKDDFANSYPNMSAYFSADQLQLLANYVKAGGNMLLTTHAAALVESIGRVPANLKPNLVSFHPNDASGVNAKIGYAADDLFDHSSHPIFAGLTTLQYSGHDYFPLISGGSERHDCVWALKDDPIKMKELETDSYMTVDFETVTNSIVLGTWQHVGDYNVMGLVEFLPAGDFKGRVIVNGLGGYEWKQNGGNNTYLSNIKKLTENSLTYLDTQKLKKVAYLLPVNLADGFSYDDALNCVDQDDERTGLQWFIDEIVEDDKGVLLRPKDLADLDPTSITTMWIHIDRDGLLNAKISSPQNATWGDLTTKANYRMIRRYVTNGGNLLLTKHAVQLVQNGGYIDRTSFAPSVEAGGAGDTPDSEGIKDNGHSWAINAVIGGGWAPSINYYVSYTEVSSGNYTTRTPTVDDGFDHRDSYLYNGLEVNNTEYPISNTTPKYQVSYIVGPGVKEDHNTIWIFENGNYDSKNVVDFQNSENAEVLGQWGHKSALDNAVIVDFKPTGAWNENAFEGHILCIGLGAYEWQLSDNTGAADHSQDNPYLDNIKQVTYNALNILENPDNPGFPVDFSYGGVSYHGETDGLLNYATIKSANASLEIYDITKVNGDITEPGKILYNGRLYEITGIDPGVFADCTNMAYADLSAFEGVVPAEIRNYFPAQTLIYLPQGSNQRGTNIVNYDGSAWTSDKLLVYDRTFFANKYEFTASEVAYNRAYPPEADGSYKTTIAMPFAISANEAEQFGKFYTFSNIISGTEEARFTRVSNGTEAYQPYMFVPKSSETSININATKIIPVLDANPAWQDGVYTLTRPLSVIQPGGTGATFFAEYRTQFLGGSDATTAVDGGAVASGFYAFRQGTYQTTSGVITALPFRAFLQTEAVTGARQYAVMLDDGDATGINTIENNTQDNGAYYTLTGIRVAKPTMGVYIKNNRKVIIKK